jgi:hypothetical protein
MKFNDAISRTKAHPIRQYDLPLHTVNLEAKDAVRLIDEVDHSTSTPQLLVECKNQAAKRTLSE